MPASPDPSPEDDFHAEHERVRALAEREERMASLAKGALMADTAETEPLRTKAAELSAKYDGATLDQLAYAWIMAHPSLPLPIIGTNKLERIQAAVKAASIKLDREDWYALWVAAKGHGIP